MDSFKQFFEASFLGLFGRGSAAPQTDPQLQQQLQQQHQVDYTKELQKFKKSIEDFAKDERFTRDDLLARLDGKSSYGDSDPLYIISHYKLPQTDWAKANDDASKNKLAQEIEDLKNQALSWFDAIHKTNTQGSNWDDRKKQLKLSLAARKGHETRAANASGNQNLLRHPGWDYTKKRK